MDGAEDAPAPEQTAAAGEAPAPAKDAAAGTDLTAQAAPADSSASAPDSETASRDPSLDDVVSSTLKTLEAIDDRRKKAGE